MSSPFEHKLRLLEALGVHLPKDARVLDYGCGAGGTVHNGVIEIQTDQRARLQLELQKLGWKVTIAGG